MKYLIAAFLIFSSIILSSTGQECSSNITIRLQNINGGFFAGQTVVLTRKSDGKRYTQISDAKGEATFTVPCNTIFDLAVTNYTDKNEIKSPPGGSMIRKLSYEPKMKLLGEAFAMSEAEKRVVDMNAELFPDTTFIKNSRMPAPKLQDLFTILDITVTDIKDIPIPDETIYITGEKRNKNFKGSTDRTGRLIVYLPKGDSYTIGFKYNLDFFVSDLDYTQGSRKVYMGLGYLGTKEIERRQKEEAERIRETEKRLKEEKEKFEAECKKAGISLEEGYRREWDRMRKDDNFIDTVINAVLNRNNWQEKLIVCDLTGSMQPYAAELSAWYQLSFKKEKNLQFVFFNDGDDKKDSQKKIGETGGIYYSKSCGIDSLGHLISYVSSRGDGGDCPENNIEALIKGTKMAKEYKEIVAIVDNNSPVKDIKLLKQFKEPVHIILCGSAQKYFLSDYLLIAWKTKGTIHTIEEDITSLTKKSEGEEITIANNTYRIMGGEFVWINKN